MAIYHYGPTFLLGSQRARGCRIVFTERPGYSSEFDWKPRSSNGSVSIVRDTRGLLLLPQFCDADVNKIECNSDGLDLLQTFEC